MSERDHTGGGGLTGATGDLTFEENDRPFIPAENREMADSATQADVTAAQIRAAPAQQGDTGDPLDRPIGGPTNMATRDDGYASEHGLNADDPAYRMERHPSAGEAGGDVGSELTDAQAARRSDSPSVGGDERSEREERF